MEEQWAGGIYPPLEGNLGGSIKKAAYILLKKYASQSGRLREGPPLKVRDPRHTNDPSNSGTKPCGTL